MSITFTQDNTTGYSDAELAALNAELAAILATIDEDDDYAREQVTKAFVDENARR